MQTKNIILVVTNKNKRLEGDFSALLSNLIKESGAGKINNGQFILPSYLQFDLQDPNGRVINHILQTARMRGFTDVLFDTNNE